MCRLRQQIGVMLCNDGQLSPSLMMPTPHFIWWVVDGNIICGVVSRRCRWAVRFAPLPPDALRVLFSPSQGQLLPVLFSLLDAVSTPIVHHLHVRSVLPHNRTMTAQSLARNAKAPPDDGGHPSWGPEEGSPPLWGCPFKIGTSICGVLVRSSWSMAKMSHY